METWSSSIPPTSILLNASINLACLGPWLRCGPFAKHPHKSFLGRNSSAPPPPNPLPPGLLLPTSTLPLPVAYALNWTTARVWISNIEQGITNYEVLWFPTFVFGKDSATWIILTAKSIKRSSRSNVLLSFYIRYSLFDIRYSNTSRILSHSLVPLYASPRRVDLWVIVSPLTGEGFRVSSAERLGWE
jgi:hypothetical protein